MKRVLILIPSLACGGAERSATLLANELVKTGLFKVTIFSLSNRKICYSLDKSISVHFIDEQLKWKNKITKNVKRAKFISDKAEELGIELIIGFTYIGGIISCMVNKRIRIKNIVCERSDPNKVGILTKLIRKYYYRFTAGAVFQTQDAQLYFNKIIKNKSIVIQNSIDVSSLPDCVPFSKRKNVIVSVGRLEPVKNQKMLISAFKLVHELYPDYNLLIYGDGSLKQELDNLILDLGLNGNVKLMGVSHQIFDDIKTAKIMAFTSNYEGFPNAVLEAMAMGLVVISTDCPIGGPRNIIKSGDNGYLIPVGDIDALKSKMIECISSPTEMGSISDQAISVRKTNNTETIIKKWEEYILSII